MAEMDEDENAEIKRKDKSTYMQVLLGCVTNITVISPGMSLGFSAIALPSLLSKDSPNPMTEEQASWVASIASIATPIGCLLSGPILDLYGRKRGLYTVNLVILIGWTILVFSSESPELQYTQILLGRFFTGLATGLSSIPATVYISEISDPKWRGMLITWTTTAFAAGVMFIYILGAIWQNSWRIPAAISCVIPIFAALLIYYFVPESPQWLLTKNRFKEAKQSLIRLHGYKTNNIPRSIDNEIDSVIKQSARNFQMNQFGFKNVTSDGLIYNDTCVSNKSNYNKFLNEVKYFSRPECYKPFLIMTVFFFFQQFGGTFVIIFYAISIIKMAEITIDPYIVAVAIGITRTIAVVLMSFICKKYGRRPPSIVSGSGMCICMVTLAGYLYLYDCSSINKDTLNNVNWIPFVMLMLYFFISTIGFLTIPFAMLGEVFPTQVRGVAGGLTSCCGYTFSFIIIKTFPQMLEAFGRYGVFLFYGTSSLVGTIFVIFFLPETKGKTLQEIQDYFKNSDVIRNKKELRGLKLESSAGCSSNDDKVVAINVDTRQKERNIRIV